jgi:LPXTG-motif cell wall-anchored protein
VVVESNGTVLCGQDVQFTTGGTEVPIGTIGGIGLAVLAGCALFITQRRRRQRRSAQPPGAGPGAG